MQAMQNMELEKMITLPSNLKTDQKELTQLKLSLLNNTILQFIN